MFDWNSPLAFYASLTLRIVSIMMLLLVLTLLTGRRKIGELPVFDFLVVITLGSVVGSDIADFKLPHFDVLYAITVIILLQTAYSYFVLKSRKFGNAVNFDPVVVIENGQLVKKNLAYLKYTVDNILMMLREKDIFDLNEVEFAVIESSGKLSVLKKSQHQALTPSTMHMATGYKGLPTPLIVEGKIYDQSLQRLNLDRSWLMAELQNYQVTSADEVFYAALNTDGTLYVSKDVPDHPATPMLH
ncbi:YetF domain-containing protein [Heliophilum fasciatum]|uniref:YetF domain-containing protein n=1 Tax=Heliophilum fasciatum TaxID=35700 RepID=UPI001FAAA36B|nr:DUF421 domain-containing protein [Heliophilum fasciatum]MCW2278216.1 uncharacterized membrane protein YcaP (DUF421 family) [Heliophilum fasciatum]